MARSGASKRDQLRRSESWRKRVGAALRAARTRAGLTQPKLAERAGLDWTTISQIENGASAPDLATMEAIADALGVDLDIAIGRASQERRESISALVDGLTPPAASLDGKESRSPGRDPWPSIQAVEMQMAHLLGLVLRVLPIDAADLPDELKSLAPQQSPSTRRPRAKRNA